VCSSIVGRVLGVSLRRRGLFFFSSLLSLTLDRRSQVSIFPRCDIPVISIFERPRPRSVTTPTFTEILTVPALRSQEPLSSKLSKVSFTGQYSARCFGDGAPMSMVFMVRVEISFPLSVFLSL